MKHGGAVYILTNKNNNVLYTGVTSNLEKRIWEHKTKENPNSFTSKYNVNKLVYMEFFSRIEEAISREKQIKGGSRKIKLDLISQLNPGWEELYERIDEF